MNLQPCLGKNKGARIMGTLPDLAKDYLGSPGCLPAPPRLWSGGQEGCVLCRVWAPGFCRCPASDSQGTALRFCPHMCEIHSPSYLLFLSLENTHLERAGWDEHRGLSQLWCSDSKGSQGFFKAWLLCSRVRGWNPGPPDRPRHHTTQAWASGFLQT